MPATAALTVVSHASDSSPDSGEGRIFPLGATAIVLGSDGGNEGEGPMKIGDLKGSQVAMPINETKRIQFILFSTQNRTFGLNLVTIHRILIPVIGHLIGCGFSWYSSKRGYHSNQLLVCFVHCP
jgi:hypothetical protein